MSEALKPGDILFLAPGYNYAKRREPRSARIEKVGRKWLTLADNLGRVDRQTMASDSGGYLPAWYVYRTGAEYRKEKRRSDLRSALSIRFGSWSGTSDLTDEQLEGIAKIVGIE